MGIYSAYCKNFIDIIKGKKINKGILNIPPTFN